VLPPVPRLGPVTVKFIKGKRSKTIRNGGTCCTWATGLWKWINGPRNLPDFLFKEYITKGQRCQEGLPQQRGGHWRVSGRERNIRYRAA